jgi:tetratricopeptide (TPR) repeat protein
MNVVANEPVFRKFDEAHAEFRRSLARGDVSVATRVSELAKARWPNELRAHLMSGSLLEREGRHAEAAALYTRLRTRHPANSKLAARLAVTLAASAQGEQALSIYKEAIIGSPLPEAEKTRLARSIASRMRRSPEAYDLLQQRLDVEPENAGLLCDLGSAARSLGNTAAAAKYLNEAARLGPLPGWAHERRLDAQAELRRRAGAWPVVDGPLEKALEEALRQQPRNPLFVRQINRLPLSRAAWQRLQLLVAEASRSPSEDGFFKLESAFAMLQAGDVARCRQLLADIPSDSRWAHRARPLAHMLATTPVEQWQHARLEDDKSAEVQIQRKPEARATLLVFATLTGNFMMLPLAMLDALLADLPLNVVYLRDTTSVTQGLRGLRSLGPTLDDTLARLKALVSELGAPELITLGASGSGLSAIRYAARLGASRAVTFGALATPVSEAPAAGSSLQSRQRLPKVPPQGSFRDVATELSAAPDLTVEFHYGADCELDSVHAARLQGVPGITFLPAMGVEHHYVALSTIARGDFQAAIWPFPESVPSKCL